MMKQAFIIACWMGVAAVGVFLRFDELAARPLHADEATGARITARRMESGGAAFDPKHYHGPLLADLTMPLCRARSEYGWREMSKSTLRLVPAIAGTLLVLLPLAGRRRFGDGPMLLAAAFMATSPLLVYYSRMFIHESLLGFFGIAFLFSLARAPRHGLPGFLLGLMFATKETFAISVIAWSGAAALLAFENRRSIGGAELRSWFWPAAMSLLAFVFTAVFFYTDAFRHPRGVIDAVRTFFVYETVEGHDKLFGWYFQVLAWPQKAAGLWWFGTPLVLLALCAFVATFRKTDKPDSSRPVVRFLAYSAAGHFLIYSLIAYKTPWLAYLPWAHICLLAGFSVRSRLENGRDHSPQRSGEWSAREQLGNQPMDGHSPSILADRPEDGPCLWRVSLTAIACVCLVAQFQQALAATGRLASDERNPFAYVPTRGDVEKLESWLGELRTVMPTGSLDSVAVVGRDYWPLPWYLRSFEKTGYWNEPPPDLATFPLVFAMPDAADTVKQALEATHVALPRGLRANVPVILHVRNDVWDSWMNTENR